MLEATLLLLAVFLIVLTGFLIKAATVWDRLITLNLITLKLAMMMMKMNRLSIDRLYSVSQPA